MHELAHVKTPGAPARKGARQAVRPLVASLVGIGFGSLSLGLAAEALAQTASKPAMLSRIVVEGQGLVPENRSSRKATASLEDTPQTITVIPEQVYKEQSARNLSDVLRNTPGITYNGGENGFATGAANFSMRGFESGSNVFIDGVRDSGNYNRDIFNLEAVEVVKGPAGENGRGGPGGYVNLVTKTPKSTDAYHGSLSYGFDRYDSKPRLRATSDMNKVFSDSVAVRLNLMVEDGGVAGRDVAKARAWGVAPSVTFGLAPRTSATLAYSHLETRDRPDFGVPTSALPGFEPSANDLRHNEITQRIDRDNFYGHTSDFDKVKQDALSARIRHELSPSTSLENFTRYSDTDRNAIYTVVRSVNKAGMVTPSRQGFSRKNTVLSNQTNLRTTFETDTLKHTLSTGLELSREESKSGREFTLRGLSDASVYGPDPGRPLNSGTDQGPAQHDTVRVDTIAAYLYNTVEFSPQWQATGGVRLERYRSRIDSTDPSYPANNYSRTDTNLNGSLGVVYKPQDNASIYASVGLSTLPPGSFLSNPDISRNGPNAFPTLAGQDNPDSKTQRAINYEIGTKWQFFEKRLSATAAVFHTERRNVAMTNGTQLLGYGKQQVRGLELGLAGYITPQWAVFGGATLQKSKRIHSAAIDAALKAKTPGDFGSATSTSGDELAFTPRTQANLWTTYSFPVGLTLGAGVQYVGSSYVGRPDNVDRVVKNGINGKLPSYTVFNAMAAYEVNKNLMLRLNVDNIFDKTYATSTNWSARRVQLGAPRSFILNADMSF